MCFNKESSLKTFLIVLFGSIFLFYRNYPYDRIMGVFFFTVGIMQLAEYFLWSDQKCKNINHYSTLSVYYILIIQVLLFLIAFKYLKNTDNYFNKKILNIFIFIVVICSIILIYYSIININKYKLCSKPLKGETKYIIWDIKNLINGLPNIIYYIFTISYFIYPLLLLTIKNKNLRIPYTLIFYISLIISYISTHILKDQWKSLWCIIANYFIIIPIIFGYLEYGYKK